MCDSCTCEHQSNYIMCDNVSDKLHFVIKGRQHAQTGNTQTDCSNHCMLQINQKIVEILPCLY